MMLMILELAVEFKHRTICIKLESSDHMCKLQKSSLKCITIV